jgi:hypothetical protein
MFSITSSHAYNWPGLKFKLVKGENSFAAADQVPEGARAKLAHLAAHSVVSFSEQPAWAPKAAPKGDKKAAPKGDDFDPADVDLTPEALGKLKFDQLKQVAALLDIDVAEAKSKQEVADAILKDQADDSA